MKQTEPSDSLILSGCSRALSRLGAKLHPQWEQSRTAKLVSALRRDAKQSVLLGRLAKHGACALFFAVLAIYPLPDAAFHYLPLLSGLKNSWQYFLLGFGLLIALVRRLRTQTPTSLRTTEAALPILQFVLTGIFLLAAVFRFPQVNYAGFLVTMSGLLWFYTVTRLYTGENVLLRFCRISVCIATAISALGVLEYLLAVPIPSEWLEPGETEIRTRAFALFPNPNQLGEYLELMLPIAVGLLNVVTDRQEKRRIALISIPVMLAAGLFTMSRGAWIAIAAVFFVYILLENRRLLPVLLLAGICVLLLPSVTARFSFLFTDEFAFSAAKAGRVVRWQTAIRYLWQGDPWLGLGFGMYGGEIANNHPVMSEWTYYWVDNYYIRILAENGIVGLVSYCLMQLGVLCAGVRAWYRLRGTRYRPLAAGLLSGLVGILLHCLFECAFDVGFVTALYWTAAALLLSMGRQPDKNHPAPAGSGIQTKKE